MLQKFWKSTLVTLFIASLVMALQPDLRAAVRGAVLKDYRTIVSSASSDLLHDGTVFNIEKVKTREGLFLEIYQPQNSGGQKLVEKIEIKDQSDGYFSFNGLASNLAVDDIDGDGHLEIVAPGFDRDLVGHLNIYRFDLGSHNFHKVVL
jgi:hypothetical protein